MTEQKTKLAVYTVTEYESIDGTKDWWTEIGTAFKNKDGSLTILLKALPLDGKLIVRKKEKKEGAQP